MWTLSNAAQREPRSRRARAATATILFFAACGSAFAQTPPPAMTNATVTVAPTSGPAPAGVCTTKSGFYVCVDRDPVITPSVAVGKDVQIVWTLSGQGWTFVKNKGIDIKNRKNWQVKEDTPTKYTATNKKENGVLYKYDINVTNGTATLLWDPTIMN